jgi:hypothetical protein
VVCQHHTGLRLQEAEHIQRLDIRLILALLPLGQRPFRTRDRKYIEAGPQGRVGAEVGKLLRHRWCPTACQTKDHALCV